MLPEDGELAVQVQRNLGQELERTSSCPCPASTGCSRQARPSGSTMCAEDGQLLSQQSIQHLQLKTILCLPLTVQGRRIGVVYLDSRRTVTEPRTGRPSRPSSRSAPSPSSGPACPRKTCATRCWPPWARWPVPSSTTSRTPSSWWRATPSCSAAHRRQQDPAPLEQDPGCVDRLSQLSQDVLDYSKVREPRREMVDLARLPGRHHRAAGAPGRGNGRGTPGRGAGLPDQAGPGRFTRVIENLLANALDATVGISGEVLVSWIQVTGGMQIRVEDQGRGIPKRVIKRIFEPFFSYGKKKGTGLGMATVKKIVEEHGGTLEVTSEEGEGTEVIILLPDHPITGAIKLSDDPPANTATWELSGYDLHARRPGIRCPPLRGSRGRPAPGAHGLRHPPRPGPGGPQRRGRDAARPHGRPAGRGGPGRHRPALPGHGPRLPGRRFRRPAGTGHGRPRANAAGGW